MLRGTVTFRARVVDRERGVTFSPFEFNPDKLGVDKVEIEGPNDKQIRITVHLSEVADYDAGIKIAQEVHEAVLDRISFCHNLAIENGWARDDGFFSIDPEAADVLKPQMGDDIRVVEGTRISLSLPSADLKAELEQARLPGERNFGLFRSARLSTSPVEEFMHLYNLLLMFFDDDQPGAQERLDNFINKKPSVPPKRRRRKRNPNETVYTRLRNQFGHSRPGKNIEQTKVEMAERLKELREITKRAIKSLS